MWRPRGERLDDQAGTEERTHVAEEEQAYEEGRRRGGSKERTCCSREQDERKERQRAHCRLSVSRQRYDTIECAPDPTGRQEVNLQ